MVLGAIGTEAEMNSRGEVAKREVKRAIKEGQGSCVVCGGSVV